MKDGRERAERRLARFRFLAGLLLGLAVPLLLGEMYARFRPPEDLYSYLGEQSPLTGIYRQDAVLGADYVSYEKFREQYAERLAALGPLDSPQPTWLWMGNSFVQAPGMLGDTATAAQPETRMFYLQRNELPYLRVAQTRLLLHEGLRPQRIIFALLPVDTLGFGKQPLTTIRVTERGAITYRLRSAGAFDGLIARSRLAKLGWVRSGRHAGEPSFRMKDVTKSLSPSLTHDLRAFMNVLGDLSKQYAVPITVLLIPNREQILGQAEYAYQDGIAAMCREEAIDCFDARDTFSSRSDKASLFLPDFHFTPTGNRVLLAGLLAHVETVKSRTPGAPR